MTTAQHWKELDRSKADIVVIGGGITGAGIAWDAALRGYDCLLFEQRDFASGTSSRSSKLIHGGLRYLQQGELKLIYEAVNERRRLRKLARHLVRPLGFYFPGFAGSSPGLTVMRVGLLVYEALTGFRVDKLHKRLSAEATKAAIPGLRAQGLHGSVFYYDAKAADARLVWECILGAKQAGAGAFNYSKVVKAEQQDNGWKLTITNSQTSESATIEATTVIAAVGPWGNKALKAFFPELPDTMRPTKGVHIVLPQEKLPISDAVTMQHPRDKRVIFIIPGRGYVYCGTTDTDYEGEIAEPGITREDVDYLLEGLNHHFPDANFDDADITATWSGLRPLVQEAGKSAYQVSREHQIGEVQPGFFTVEGGKLTTFRAMAEQAVDIASKRVKANGRTFEDCLTTSEPLPGARGIYEENDFGDLIARIRKYLNCEPDIASHLAFQYGTRCMEVLPYIEKEPMRAIAGLPQTWGEIQYVLEREDIVELEDLFLRRTEIYYQAVDNGLDIVTEVGKRLRVIRGWDAERTARCQEAYRKRVSEGLAFKNA